MEFIRNIFSTKPLTQMDEMKRLSQLSDSEFNIEVRKSREKIIKKRKLDLLPNNFGEGMTGMKNLGNICFISASLQCLIHCADLHHYFFNQSWAKDINPLTSIMYGELVSEYFFVLCLYWSSINDKWIDISALHNVLIKTNKTLADYSQHDIQEFLAFFLDGLHEDLNRTIIRKYEQNPEWMGEQIEIFCNNADKLYLKRNDSVIVKYFHGQFSSKIQCPSSDCGHFSISCEPFNMISLNLPSTHSLITFEFFFLPASYEAQIEKIVVSCMDNETIQDLLIHAFKEKPQMSSKKMKLALYKNLKIENRNIDSKKLTTGQIHEGPFLLFIYEAFDEQISELIFGIQRTNELRQSDPQQKCSMNLTVYNKEFFDGVEREIEVPRDVTFFEINLLVYLVHRKIFIDSGFFPSEIDPTYFPQNREDLLREFGFFKKFDSKKNYSDGFEIRIRNELKEISMNQGFFEGTSENKINVSFYLDFRELSYKLKLRNLTLVQLSSIESDQPALSLKSCLDKFVQKEILDDENKWFCPKCRTHRKASKEMVISKLPNNFIVHFKRFKQLSPGQESYRKFQDMIIFETTNLDISPYSLEKNKPALYDLFAVCNHFGNVGNGHYTAFCKNLKSEKWVCYDDNYVKEIEPKDVVSKHAYLLFYKRRN